MTKSWRAFLFCKVMKFQHLKSMQKRLATFRSSLSFCLFPPFFPRKPFHSHHDCSMNNRHYSPNLKNPSATATAHIQTFSILSRARASERPRGDTRGKTGRRPRRTVPHSPPRSPPCMALWFLDGSGGAISFEYRRHRPRRGRRRLSSKELSSAQPLTI